MNFPPYVCHECGNRLQKGRLYPTIKCWESGWRLYHFCKSLCIFDWLSSYYKKPSESAQMAMQAKNKQEVEA